MFVSNLPLSRRDARRQPFRADPSGGNLLCAAQGVMCSIMWRQDGTGTRTQSGTNHWKQEMKGPHKNTCVYVQDPRAAYRAEVADLLEPER